MVILIISILLLLALTAINFIELKNNKTLIMAGIVMSMLLLNILEELTMPDPTQKFTSISHSQHDSQDLSSANFH